MEMVLLHYSVAEHDNKSLLNGIKDMSFNDLEDSCQYHLATKSGCDVFITFNLTDYLGVEKSSVDILTPQQFIEKFCKN